MGAHTYPGTTKEASGEVKQGEMQQVGTHISAGEQRSRGGGINKSTQVNGDQETEEPCSCRGKRLNLFELENDTASHIAHNSSQEHRIPPIISLARKEIR
jgi:hypothetical protein